jgi:hypothetical protein
MRSTIMLVIAAAITLSGFGNSYCSAEEAQKAKAKAKAKSTADADDAQPAKATARKASTTQPSAFMLIVPVPIDRVIVPSVLPVGGSLAPDVEAIRDTLASATEAALTEDGFNDFVERLVDADRNRVGKFDAGDISALNGAAARVRTAWKNKFNSDFDLHEEDDVYAPFSVVQGMITMQMDPNVKTMPANDRGDYNLEPGREVAVVSIPGRHGLHDTTVLMINEAFGWKIDVPNTVSGRDLHGNLVQHLNTLADSVEKWPNNREAAIRFVTHHVLLGAIDADGKTATATK